MERGQAVAALLFTMLVWGIGPLFIRFASVTLGPADALVIRYALVAVLYASVLAMSGAWRIERADWPRLLLVSLVGMLGYNLCSAFGFLWVPAGIGGLIIGTQPLLIVLCAVLLAGERMTAFAVIGLVTAFAGTALLFWRDLSAPGENAQLLLGALLIFLCGVAWSVYVVCSRPLTQKYGTIRVSAWSILIATVPMLTLATPGTIRTLTSMGQAEWAVMAYLVVLATFVSTMTWNYGASRLSATASGAFLYLVPVIAVLAGAIGFGEAVTLEILIGGFLIVLGVAIAQSGPALVRLGRSSPTA